MVVVLQPLCTGDASVLVLGAVLLSVVSLESVQEFAKHVVFRTLATHHIGVLFSVVNTLDVAEVDLAVQLNINFIESFLDNGLSLNVHLTDYSSNELVEIDLLIVVSVAHFEDSLDLTISACNVIVIHGTLHFFVVKRAISVLIHDSE